jgi:Flp pilus assembly protein TadG
MASLIRRLRACAREEEGAELIEFVIVFPILLLILSGILEFGMLMRSYEVVTNAAREGARVAVPDGYSANDVQNRVTQYANAAGLGGGAPVATSVDVPVTTAAGTFTARQVTVTWTYQMAVLSGVSALFGSPVGNVPLASRAVMRAEVQAAPAP